MTLSFRPMTPSEISERDAKVAAQKRRLGGKDGIGQMYWLGRMLGAGIPVEVARDLWDHGHVLADMEDITDEAVREALG